MSVLVFSRSDRLVCGGLYGSLSSAARDSPRIRSIPYRNGTPSPRSIPNRRYPRFDPLMLEMLSSTLRTRLRLERDHDSCHPAFGVRNVECRVTYLVTLEQQRVGRTAGRQRRLLCVGVTDANTSPELSDLYVDQHSSSLRHVERRQGFRRRSPPVDVRRNRLRQAVVAFRRAGRLRVTSVLVGRTAPRSPVVRARVSVLAERHERESNFVWTSCVVVSRQVPFSGTRPFDLLRRNRRGWIVVDADASRGRLPTLLVRIDYVGSRRKPRFVRAPPRRCSASCRRCRSVVRRWPSRPGIVAVSLVGVADRRRRSSPRTFRASGRESAR